jgi:serine/threonine-protein kinase
MLTGRRAFGGDTIVDTLARVLDHEPEWTSVPAAVPPAVGRLLVQCLEKDVARRLRDIGEARIRIDDARTTARGTLPPDAPPRISVTIAVLPFQSLSSDPERAYFGDGLTEETIAALGRVDPERIRVVARTSSMAYKQSAKTAAQIGHELRADYLVESSVRSEARHVRIVTQLTRVEDETQVWSATYDRTPESILCVQDEIGNAIGERFVSPLHFGLIHAGLGRRDKALDCLERSFDVRAVTLPLLPTDPLWDDLRDEPRIRALLTKHGLPQHRPSSPPAGRPVR